MGEYQGGHEVRWTHGERGHLISSRDIRTGSGEEVTCDSGPGEWVGFREDGHSEHCRWRRAGCV